jgi:asparagine synthase (glutamine-hydrolysing)
MLSISPTLVHPDSLEDVFETLTAGFEEPFDGVFVILKAIFLAANERGDRVVLDGAGGDVVLSQGSYIVRLLRQGQWKLAVAEIIAEQRHWHEGSPVPSLVSYARTAILPESIKKLVRGRRERHRAREYVKASLISEDFALNVGIDDRFEQMRGIFPSAWVPDDAVEFCDRIWPCMTAGRERYARIAAATGVEARDPFIDKRVVDYCSRLPGRMRFRDGWPKMILREIMADTLPHEVLWTRRKPHVGWLFSEELTKLAKERGALDITILEEWLKGYVDLAALAGAWQNFREGGDSQQIHYAYILSIWLRKTSRRPVVPDQ